MQSVRPTLATESSTADEPPLLRETKLREHTSEDEKPQATDVQGATPSARAPAGDQEGTVPSHWFTHEDAVPYRFLLALCRIVRQLGALVILELIDEVSGSLWSQMPEDSSGDVPAYDTQPCTICRGARHSHLHQEIQQASTHRSKRSWQREYTLSRLA